MRSAALAEQLGGDEHGGEDEEEAGDVGPALGRQEGNGGRQEQPCPTSGRLRARAEHERVMEEGQLDTLLVLGLDGDLGRRSAAIHVELGRLTQDRVRRPLQAALDHVISDGRRDAGLEPHRVLDTVEPNVHLSDVNPVVQRDREERQRDQAAPRAASVAIPPTGHHWDWAPSTMLVTSLSNALLRPSASWPGA